MGLPLEGAKKTDALSRNLRTPRNCLVTNAFMDDLQQGAIRSFEPLMASSRMKKWSALLAETSQTLKSSPAAGEAQ